MIVTYLIKALTEKDSVYISNLGLFCKQYQAAQILDGQIIPPCHKVVFDPNYDGNGFAFTMFVSMKAGLLTSDATVKVNQWVNELKNALDNNKSVSFENFGTFAKNGDGIITFESDRISELNIEFEGMETVPLSHQAVGVAVENQEEEKEDNIPESDIENTPVSITTSETEKTEVETDEEVQTTLVDNLEETATEENAESETAKENINTSLTESEETSSTIAEVEESDVEVVEEEKQMTLIENEDISTTIEETEKDDDNNNGNEEEEEEEQEEEDVVVDDTSKKKHKKRRAWLVIVIIIVVLAILDALGYIFREEIEKFYYQQIDKNNTEEIEAQESEDFIYENPQDTYAEIDSTVEEADIEAIEENENTADKQESGTINKVPKATTDNGLTNDDNFIIRFEKGKHYVIAGSFPTEADVRKHIKQQHLEKYNPKAVKQDGVSNLRVCIGIFDNEADAENFRNSVNAKYWVLN